MLSRKEISMEELMFYNGDKEMNDAIYKGMEIFAIFKDTILKMEDQILSLEDKKVLALLLGIEYSENVVSKSLEPFFENHWIKVNVMPKEPYECIGLYNHFFKSFIPSLELMDGCRVEDLAMRLFSVPLIIALHEYSNYPRNRVKQMLDDLVKTKRKVKTLQN